MEFVFGRIVVQKIDRIRIIGAAVPSLVAPVFSLKYELCREPEIDIK